MKNYLLLILSLTLSFGNVNGQNQQEKSAILKGCIVTSNFSYTKIDCDTVSFTANPTSNSSTTILGYYWDFGDGNNSTSQNPTHNYSNDGNYTVTLTVIGFNSTTGDCCNDTASQIININCGVPCGVVINNIEELNPLGDDNVVFYAVTQLSSGWNIISSTFVVTYQNGSVVTYNGTTNPSTGYPQILIPVVCTNKVMQVTATVIVSNSSGTSCSDTKTHDWIPIGVCGTGGFFKVSPNPVKNNLNIEIDEIQFKKHEKIELIIYDFNGNIQQKHAVKSNSQPKSLDVSKLKSGMYVLKLISNDKIIDTHKIIVSD